MLCMNYPGAWMFLTYNKKSLVTSMHIVMENFAHI